jgi:hypothetical protein
MRLPRFSLRTLAVIVTLVCAYFGVWEATKRYGLRMTSPIEPDTFVNGKGTSFPLVIWRDEMEGVYFDERGHVHGYRAGHTRYYLWFMGAMIKLPYESEW